MKKQKFNLTAEFTLYNPSDLGSSAVQGGSYMADVSRKYLGLAVKRLTRDVKKRDKRLISILQVCAGNELVITKDTVIRLISIRIDEVPPRRPRGKVEKQAAESSTQHAVGHPLYPERPMVFTRETPALDADEDVVDLSEDDRVDMLERKGDQEEAIGKAEFDHDIRTDR